MIFTETELRLIMKAVDFTLRKLQGQESLDEPQYKAILNKLIETKQLTGVPYFK